MILIHFLTSKVKQYFCMHFAVQYDKNKQDGTTNRTGNDSTEVFDSAHHIFRVRSRISEFSHGISCIGKASSGLVESFQWASGKLPEILND